eukprot:3938683-Rhodomonas_salina.1
MPLDHGCPHLLPSLLVVWVCWESPVNPGVYSQAVGLSVVQVTLEWAWLFQLSPSSTTLSVGVTSGILTTTSRLLQGPCVGPVGSSEALCPPCRAKDGCPVHTSPSRCSLHPLVEGSTMSD